MGFGVFVMMQRQMVGLRERAMRTAVAPSASPVTVPDAAKPPRPTSNSRAIEPAAPAEMVVVATT